MPIGGGPTSHLDQPELEEYLLTEGRLKDYNLKIQISGVRRIINVELECLQYSQER